MEAETGFKQTDVGKIPFGWELRAYGDVFRTLSTATFSRADLSENEEVFYVHYGDVHTRLNHFLDPTTVGLPTIGKDRAKRYSYLKNGDVIMVDASEDIAGVSKSVEVRNLGDSKAISGLHTFLLRDKEKAFADGFRAYITSMPVVVNQMASYATGIKVYGVSKSSLKRIQIPVPPMKEQEAIAAALGDIDCLLNSLERVIFKKLGIKKGALHMLLSGNKRLSGFCDEWNSTNLGNCLATAPRYGINAPAVPFSESLPTYIRITDISEDGSFVRENRVSVRHVASSDYLLQEGDVVFARTGASTGKSYLYNPSDGDLVFAGFLIRIQVNQRVLTPEFLKHFVETVDYWNWVTVMSMRSGQPGINGNEFKEMPLRLPSVPEQKAISDVLQCMDDEIDALRSQCKKYTAIKIGMIEELLTGKTRFV